MRVSGLGLGGLAAAEFRFTSPLPFFGMSKGEDEEEEEESDGEGGWIGRAWVCGAGDEHQETTSLVLESMSSGQQGACVDGVSSVSVCRWCLECRVFSVVVT